MARMRRAMALRPVQSFKRIIDTSGGLAAGTVSITTVASTSDSSTAVDPTGTSDTGVGARLSAIFYTVYVFSDATASTSPLVDMFWWKNPGGTSTAPVAGNTDISPSKRFIIHEEKGLAGNRTTGTPMVIKGVLRIPKSMARFGINDQFELRILSPVAGFFCSKHIYRVYN